MSTFRASLKSIQCFSYFRYTTNISFTGVPALSIPIRLSAKGLPLSLQLIGPHFSESLMLSLAYWLEKEAAFPQLDLEVLESDMAQSVS